MKVTIPKNAKHFVLALKCIAQWTKKVNLYVNARTGLRIEALTDKRCGYVRLHLSPDDLMFSETNEHEDLEFGVDLKGFLHGMREITTLTDVIILDIVSDTMSLIVKTKHAETKVVYKHEHILNQKLDVGPPDLKIICAVDLNTKDIDDAIKKCALKKLTIQCLPIKLNQDLLHFHPFTMEDTVLMTHKGSFANGIIDEPYSQNYLVDDFSEMIKATLAKKATLTVSKGYPIKVSYKIVKNSVFDLYLCECIV